MIESFSSYGYGRPISDADRDYVKDVMARVQDELSDCGNTDEMFPEYGRIATFILANRRIAREVREVPNAPHR